MEDTYSPGFAGAAPGGTAPGHVGAGRGRRRGRRDDARRRSGAHRPCCRAAGHHLWAIHFSAQV